MPVLRDFELVLAVDDVLRAQGGDPAAIRARRPFFVDIAEEALVEGMSLLQPAVIYRQLPVKKLTHESLVLYDGGALTGPLIGQHLASASQVVVVVCTVGHELEARAAQVMASDFQRGLALDGVGSAAAEELAAAACHRLEEQAGLDSLGTTTPISPGMVGWPASEGQCQVFSLLDPEEIGVKLLPSGMMIPQKSLSLVIGLGVDVSDNSVPCDYCSMRDRCRYRSHGPGQNPSLS